MTATRYLQVLMIITLTVAGAVRLSCEPGEEFKSHNLTCDVIQGKDPFTLTLDDFLISTCLLNQTPACDKSNGPYVTSLMNQTITLNILNVTRQTEGKYSCSDVQNSVSSCDFKVYAKPKSVSCQVPQLQTNNVTVTCTVTKIYPSPICQFYWSKNGTGTSLTNTNITYQTISGEGQYGYFYQTCTLTQPAQNLGLGSHAFRVRAYPNVRGNPSNINYGIYSSQTPNVTINYPTVQLESCPQGYVQEGSPVSCSCRETANTFLSATTNISQGSKVKSLGPWFTTYRFTASRNNLGDLTCQATLLNWTSSPVTYKPQVAYGPKNVTVKVNNLADSGDISLCDKSQPVTVTVTCTVSVDVVSPGADFEFNINGSRMAANPVNVSSLTYSVTNGGTLSVQCTGSNSALKEITATSPEQHLQVIEPPAAPPIIDKYQDSGPPVIGADGHLTVQEGNNKIRCRAEGGYPPVSSVSVGCGSLTITSGGNVAFLDVNVSRSMEASECSCTASHSSPCYRNSKTVISLDVLFVPAVISFTANEDTGSVTVGRNTDLRLTCVAEGNPTPSLTLSKNGQQLRVYSGPQQMFNLGLMVNKTQTDCRDAGVYSCQAQAGQAVANKSVDVNVRCQQQLENPDIQNKVYTGRVNNAIAITIPVIGYPEPFLYLDSDPDLIEDSYNMTYINLGPSRGVVSLKISTVTSTVFQSYKLIITNSEGVLVYNFQIQEGVDPSDGAGVNVGAVVGGVIAGIVVIAAVVLVVVCLKRKGLLKKGVRNRNEAANMQTSPGAQKAAHYENIPPKLPKSNRLSPSEDEEIRYVTRQPQYEEISDVSPNHMHKKAVDIQPRKPDNFGDFANRDVLDRDSQVVEYENAVSAF